MLGNVPTESSCVMSSASRSGPWILRERLTTTGLAGPFLLKFFSATRMESSSRKRVPYEPQGLPVEQRFQVESVFNCIRRGKKHNEDKAEHLVGLYKILFGFKANGVVRNTLNDFGACGYSLKDGVLGLNYKKTCEARRKFYKRFF